MFTVFSFLLAIGVLVTVHEFGHYWVARKAGVKVLRFSVGFGRPLWTWVRGADRTEYVIAALPLGGYVKMLDEREGEVAPEEAHRAFNRQSLGKRAAVVAAGPIANFLFAIIAYWIMLMLGVTGLRPYVGDVLPGSIAAHGGFESGDLIVRVEDRPVETWQEALLAMVDEGLDRGHLNILVTTGQGVERQRTLELSSDIDVTSTKGLLPQVGMDRARIPVLPRIAKVYPDSAAEAAGLRAGDRVTRAGEQPIHDWNDLVEYVHDRAGVRFDLQVERDGVATALSVTPKRVDGENGPIGQIGVSPEYDEATASRYWIDQRYGPIEGLRLAVVKTWDTTVLTLRMLGKLVTGEASLRNVSGPISIAEYAGVSASLGVSYFFSFLGLVSISLGVLNLLPVPVLDGGHLLYYLMELVRGGRPLSERAQLIGQQVGIALLLALMLLAFYNDLSRLFGPA